MKKKFRIHLGVNIDHVATLRQVRRGKVPDLVAAAYEAVKGGADSITLHLREDRRHIQDGDLPALLMALQVPINLELALVPEIIQTALRVGPHKVCIVPEKRKELTTEGGLNVKASYLKLKKVIPQFQTRDIEVSLFIDPDPEAVRLSAELGSNAIEIHTGSYANDQGKLRGKELQKIKAAAKLAASLGLKVHAGHGLDAENVKPLVQIPEIVEFNIGHSLVSEAIFCGLRRSVSHLKKQLIR